LKFIDYLLPFIVLILCCSTHQYLAQRIILILDYFIFTKIEKNQQQHYYNLKAAEMYKNTLPLIYAIHRKK